LALFATSTAMILTTMILTTMTATFMTATHGASSLKCGDNSVKLA
jgi:hypothetical protein